MNRSCGNCLDYVETSAPDGAGNVDAECRHNPPVVLLVPCDVNGVMRPMPSGMWPPTRAQFYCGKYTPKLVLAS